MDPVTKRFMKLRAALGVRLHQIDGWGSGGTRLHAKALRARTRQNDGVALRVCLAAALGLLAAACTPPPHSQWPTLTVVATRDVQPFLTAFDTARFGELDGTTVKLEILPPEQIGARLGAGQPAADLVVTADMALWDAWGRQGLLAPDPWRFRFAHERVLVLCAVDAKLELRGPADLLRPEIHDLRVLDPEHTRAGQLTRRVLDRERLARRLEPKIQEMRTEAEMLARVRDAQAQLAIGLKSRLGEHPPGVRTLLSLDPSPDLPPELAGGVLSRSANPKGAHRLWNFMEKEFRTADFGLVPRGYAHYEDLEGYE